MRRFTSTARVVLMVAFALAACEAVPAAHAHPQTRSLRGKTGQRKPVALTLDVRARKITSGTVDWTARCPGGGKQQGQILIPAMHLDSHNRFRLSLESGSFVDGRLANPYVMVGRLFVQTVAGCTTRVVGYRAQAPIPCSYWGDHDCDVDDPPGRPSFRDPRD